MNFDIFKFSLSEKESFTRDFLLIASNVRLDALNRELALKLVNDGLKKPAANSIGVYFWILKLDTLEYKIYIGKTKSLPKRLIDYSVEFQIK
ncbi:GIY-YIG nuclease family protein [Imhoffiella purpurea]|uniref:hypothetical protein n=1 Tax=Imhoffiella purpurea TaxID=1249627 RepID=UPI0012FD43B4|nr:hypothetical protein [Imhoffiella purpurea]